MAIRHQLNMGPVCHSLAHTANGLLRPISLTATTFLLNISMTLRKR